MAASGISKEFLESALGYEIEKFEVALGSNLGDGYSCAMFSVDVWKKSEPEKPLGIVVKCFPENQARQEFLDVGNVFETELLMYQEVAPALRKFQEFLPENQRVDLPFAEIYFGQYIPKQERPKLGRPLAPIDNSIIMPDLRKPSNGPFVLRDRFLGFDLDHYKLVIEGQAKLHALSWAYKYRKGLKSIYEDFPALKNDYGEIMKTFMNFTDLNIKMNEVIFQDNPRIVEALHHIGKNFMSIGGLYYDTEMGQTERGDTKDSVLKVPGKVLENEEPWNVLLHGDCWSNNMMFRYDEKTGKPIEVLFIDLQMCRESDNFGDVAYALYSGSQADLRKKHLSSMLHIYYDTFTEICDKFSVPYLPGWSWEELNRRFRRASIIGGFMALGLHLMLKCTDELENLDDAMAKVEVKENSGLDNMGEFFAQMISSVKKLHPAVKPRITAVFEELIAAGVV